MQMLPPNDRPAYRTPYEVNARDKEDNEEQGYPRKANYRARPEQLAHDEVVAEEEGREEDEEEEVIQHPVEEHPQPADSRRRAEKPRAAESQHPQRRADN